MRPLLSLLLASLLAGCATSIDSDPIVQTPALLRPLAVHYPMVSRHYREEGEVVVLMQVLGNGAIGKMQIKKSSGYPRLDAAAVQALSGVTMRPAHTKSGKSVECLVALPVNFILESEAGNGAEPAAPLQAPVPLTE